MLRDFRSYTRGGSVFTGEEDIRKEVEKCNFHTKWRYQLLQRRKKVSHEWFLYSPFKDACFCFVCSLFLETSRVVVQSVSTFLGV